ncbi:DeoR family transcriptional regulator, partial [Rhizobium leguminosarum]|uniref:DeoR family transcriptional regulator n=1 Tax=Rhizobium leguminosarum TaxID=384 RepID=UPI003F9B62C5
MLCSRRRKDARTRPRQGLSQSRSCGEWYSQGGPVYPAERHKWLIDTARETGRVSVAEASTALGVVPETIRRDLDQLCNQKMLRR